MSRSLVAPAHHSLTKGRRVPTSQDFAVASANLVLCYLPVSLESSGGVVTRWRDLSGNGYHATPYGSPALDTSGVPGAHLNSVSKYLDFSIAMSDMPATMFVLTRGASSSGGVRKMKVELTDNQGSVYDRSLAQVDLFGSSTARDGQADLGDASYTQDGSGVLLHRAKYTTTYRTLHQGGAWKASSAVPTPSVRSPVYGRIGQYVVGFLPWDGVFCGLLIYAGDMSLLDERKIDAQLRAIAGQSDPFSWPPQASTDLVSDPQFILPATFPAIVGRQVQIFKDSIHYRDGYDASQTATGSLPFDPMPPDRWAVTPPAAGSYTLAFAESGFTTTTTIVAQDMLPANAAKRVLLWVGDSNTDRFGSGLIEYIGNELGASRVQMVGTQGPNPAYTYKHEGRDGWSIQLFNQAGSPFFNGGSSLDMAGYFATLAAAPDIIVWTLGQNDVYNADESAEDSTLDVVLPQFDAMIAAASAAKSGVKHLVALNTPLQMNPAIGWGTWDARLVGRRKMHKLARRLTAHFDGRTAEKIWLVQTFFRVDPIDGYVDAVHINSAPGQVQLGNAYLSSLVQIWNL